MFLAFKVYHSPFETRLKQVLSMINFSKLIIIIQTFVGILWALLWAPFFSYYNEETRFKYSFCFHYYSDIKCDKSILYCLIKSKIIKLMYLYRYYKVLRSQFQCATISLLNRDNFGKETQRNSSSSINFISHRAEFNPTPQLLLRAALQRKG